MQDFCKMCYLQNYKERKRAGSCRARKKVRMKRTVVPKWKLKIWIDAKKKIVRPHYLLGKKELNQQNILLFQLFFRSQEFFSGREHAFLFLEKLGFVICTLS